MKFTKEEISLCKQIAEKHRRLIKYGDWMILEDNPHEFPTLHFGQAFPLKTKLLPLWTISDCLEFLRERKWRVVQHYNGYGVNRKDKSPDVVAIKFRNWEKELLPEIKGTGKTLLEACLKAVLAVLEEE